MIIGNGVDIIEIDRVRRATERERFKRRVYTAAEIAYCESRGAQAAASFAVRFAGKEAVAKAFGVGFVRGSLTEIAILPDDNGCPRVVLSGYFAGLAERLNVTDVHVSLSHARSYAVAQVVVEG